MKCYIKTVFKKLFLSVQIITNSQEYEASGIQYLKE